MMTPDPASLSEYERYLTMWRQRALDAEAKLESRGFESRPARPAAVKAEQGGSVDGVAPRPELLHPKPLTAEEWLVVAEAFDGTLIGRKALAHWAWRLADERKEAEPR